MNVGRFEGAVAAIDAANADDPHEITVAGERRPKELAHAELATAWVQRLQPDANEALLLAARAHHLRRWTVPRTDYPAGRSGYLRWRRTLQQQHAVDVARILADQGYGDDTVARVQAIVQKRRLASDPEVQTFEDALCLVFLETQLDELGARLDEAKSLEVLRKTLDKMSDRAIALALELDLSDGGRRLVTAAAALPPEVRPGGP
ncbi:MAG: DUF4202 domain-containing protein [Acidimicrobiia bacterium]|nr:DUF4202 domain-containing protein [Acidimicrobiia bacterium]